MIKILTVTGYKAHELGIFDKKHVGIRYIKKAIERKLRQLLDEGLEWVLISGQLGIEFWAAETVLSLKEEFPSLKLGIFTPFLNQESRWKEETQEEYRQLLREADHVDSITKREYDSPAQLRLKNQFLIEKSDALLIVYDETKQGSPDYYLTPAMQKQAMSHYEIIYITPEDIDWIVQEERLEQSDWS